MEYQFTTGMVVLKHFSVTLLPLPTLMNTFFTLSCDMVENIPPGITTQMMEMDR